MRRRSFPRRDAAGPSALAIAMSTKTRGPQLLIRVLMGALLLSLALAALAVGAAQAASSAPNIGIPLTPTTVAPGGAPTTVTTAAEVTPTTAAGTVTQSTTGPATPTTAAAATATPTSAPAGTATPTTALGAPAATTPLNPGLRFTQGTVQFSPEYDSTDVLVIIDYQLPPDAKIPFTFQFRVPGEARMTGYSLIDTNGAFDYDRPAPTVVQGEEWDVVSVVVPKAKPVHLEYYYDPGLSLSGQREFPVVFDPPATFDRLTLEIQEPRRATGFVVSPGFGQITQGNEGFTLHAESRSGVQPGQPITAKVSYGKPDAEPSLPPASGTGAAAGGSSSAGTPAAGGGGGNGYLLWVVLAAAVAVVGIVVYRLPARRPASANSHSAQATGRTRATPARVQPSHPSQSGAVSRAATRPRMSAATAGTGRRAPGSQPDDLQTAAGAQQFCTQCGDSFASTGRFCGQCGQEREGR